MVRKSIDNQAPVPQNEGQELKVSVDDEGGDLFEYSALKGNEWQPLGGEIYVGSKLDEDPVGEAARFTDDEGDVLIRAVAVLKEAAADKGLPVVLSGKVWSQESRSEFFKRLAASILSERSPED